MKVVEVKNEPGPYFTDLINLLRFVISVPVKNEPAIIHKIIETNSRFHVK